ncbi:MAG: TPR end-of-group domain-containing protein, partial [Polyangiaceae bacterium]
VSREGTPDERYRADRLLVRITWSISDDLYRKTGRLLEGFEARPWRERRAIAYEMEKQGGADALPTLRRILERDPSENVQAVAAESLARLGDPEGAAFLARMGAKPLVQSPEVLAGIALDQGNRYLEIRRFEQAIAEYNRVLEVQPKNQIALYNLACAYALMGDKERAFDYLQKTIDAGYDDFDYMDKDDDLRSLRDDPRYKRMGEAGRLKKQTESGGDQ